MDGAAPRGTQRDPSGGDVARRGDLARRGDVVLQGDVVVLGAGGTLGRLVCAELERRGRWPIRIARRDARDPAAIARAGAPLIVNCAGASVALGLGHGWRGYGAVDVPIGLAAVEAARRTGARLVYVAVHHRAVASDRPSLAEMRATAVDPRASADPRASTALRECAYVAAHERVASAVLGDTKAASGGTIDGAVVRATGFFSAFAALLPLARRGWLFDLGDGRARTNPIAETDLAEIIVDVALGRSGPREISAGGPEILTRRQIFEEVAAAAASNGDGDRGGGAVRRVRIVGAPVWPAALGSFALRALHPRIGQFVQFATLLARHDVIAPALGTTRFADYLARAASPVAGAAHVA